MSLGTLYAIGHSSHSLGGFLGLLRGQGIEVVVDVRSTPYSRLHPQFSKEALAAALREAGMKYVFFGKELGARPDDPACYVDGQVRYACLADRALFKQAVGRIRDGSATHRIALMCAEAEPLDCHRTILVAQALAKAGLQVQHILADGSLESHEDTLNRLVGPLRAGEPEALDKALAQQEARIAYRQPTRAKGGG